MVQLGLHLEGVATASIWKKDSPAPTNCIADVEVGPGPAVR